MTENLGPVPMNPTTGSGEPTIVGPRRIPELAKACLTSAFDRTVSGGCAAPSSAGGQRETAAAMSTPVTGLAMSLILV